MRTTLNVKQGSKEWLLERANSDGTASEAPAMSSVSKHQSRDELLFVRKTGITKEVDSRTQALFDKGHAAEASARSIAEKIIGEELSPVTMTYEANGLKLLASLDGITFGGDIIWEHKLWNANLAELVEDGELPEQYKIQLDQQLIVSGAKKALFMVSDGTQQNMVHCWYETDMVREDALIDGWVQFKKDLETYTLPEAKEKVEADIIQSLPVPSIVARGSLVQSNLSDITPLFDTYLQGVKTTLKTDQDFADGEANAKHCRDSAKSLLNIADAVIGQVTEINEAVSTLRLYAERFNAMGLKLEKSVKEQKESIKANAILVAKNAYLSHVSAIEKELPFTIQAKLPLPDFALAIKGVKTIETMQSRINDCLANAKLTADVLARDVKNKLAYIFEAITGYEHLISVREIVWHEIEHIKLFIKTTIDEENTRRADREAEVKAKAEDDARKKIEAENRAKQQANEAKLVPPAEVICGVDLATSDDVSVHHIPDTTKMVESNVTAISSAIPRPSDDQIIDVVSKHFGTHREVVIGWFAEIDMDALLNGKAA